MRLFFLILVTFISINTFSQEGKLIRLYAELGEVANDTLDVGYLKMNKCVSLKSKKISTNTAKNNKLNSIIINTTDGFDIKEYKIYKINISTTKCIDGITNAETSSNCLDSKTSRFVVPNNKLFVEVYIKKKEMAIKKKLTFFIWIK